MGEVFPAGRPAKEVVSRVSGKGQVARRLELSSLPRDNWEHFLRARDLQQIFNATPEQVHGPALEIGGSDGFVSTLLRQRFEKVVTIDIRPGGLGANMCVATAESLPYKAGTFGFIFSSNVLEHVDDLNACFAELRRVITDDGIMVHTMPTTIWKGLQFVLYPLHLLLVGVIPKLMVAKRGGISAMSISAGHDHYGSSNTVGKLRPFWQRCLMALWPEIHGVSASHMEEMRRFRPKWWKARFSASGFQVLRTANLYLHSPFRLLPYRGLALREGIAKTGLSSVHAYWLSKQ